MSGTNRNFVLAYAFLVILPLLALAGILKSGRSLQAPPSIDGLWTLQLDPSHINSLPCGKVMAAAPDKTISISQSGRSLALRFPGSTISSSGVLDGTIVRAVVTLPSESSSDDNCGAAGKFALVASLDRPIDSKFLTGTISTPDCPTCAVAAFRAERQVPVASTGGH
jgi:hypothetical protein